MVMLCVFELGILANNLDGCALCRARGLTLRTYFGGLARYIRCR